MDRTDAQLWAGQTALRVRGSTLAAPCQLAVKSWVNPLTLRKSSKEKGLVTNVYIIF